MLTNIATTYKTLTYKLKLVYIFTIISLNSVQVTIAQTSPLHKSITASYYNTSLKDVIADISNKTGIRFSYSPGKIPESASITASFSNAMLSDVLTTIFKNIPVKFEMIDNYIVLKKSDIPVEVIIKTEKPVVRNATISGFIKDSVSGESLIVATVYIRSLEIGTSTNGYGFFSLTLPLGKYNIETQYLGYNAYMQNVDLQTNVKLDFGLNQKTQNIEEVVVTKIQNSDVVFKRHASQTDVMPTFVAQLPSLMGEPDVIKSLAFQPGISFFGDGSSNFCVRGGNYDQNLILLDEATLFNPSHMLGIFSPIIPDAVRSVDVYKADYPVQYGGKLSSVVDIRTKDGNKNKFSSSGDIGLISARGTVEGPIKKDASSYFVSFRKSYFDAYLKSSMPSLQGLYFFDFTTKLNLQLGEKDRLFFTIYSGKDILRIAQNGTDSDGINWGNASTTLRWNHVFGSRVFLNSTFLASNYEYFLYTSVEKNDYWNSKIGNASLKEEMTFYVSPTLVWRFGLKLSGYGFNPGNYHNSNSNNNIQVSPVNSLETIIYAGVEQEVLPWLRLNYGLRLTRWRNSGEAFVIQYDSNFKRIGVNTYKQNEVFYRTGGVEPRLTASFRTSKQSSMKMSYSKTRQYINQITNTISPFNSLEVWIPAGPNIKPQYADIVDVGYVISVKGIDLQTDIYYKLLNNQIGYNYHANMLINPEIEGEIRQGKGVAYGWEIGAEKKLGKLTGKAGYTWSRAFQKIDGLNGNRSYPATYDRPHNFVVSVAWQAKPRWLISANYNLASGMRITTPTEFYNYRGYQVPIYTAINNDQLPIYKRLDVSTSFQLNKPNRKFQHSLTFSIINLFNRKNPIFVYFNKQKTADGTFEIPTDRLNTSDITSSMRYIYGVIPSISYHFNF